jgi:hypothetical protein
MVMLYLSTTTSGRKTTMLTLEGQELIEVLNVIADKDIDLALLLAERAGITDQSVFNSLQGL